MNDQDRLRSKEWPEPPRVSVDNDCDGSKWVELASGLVVPSSAAPPRRPIAIDLFCGCGGFSLGLIQAGYAVIAAADNWATAGITYLYNLGAYPCQMVWVEDGDADRFEKALLKGQKKGKPLTLHTSGGARGGRDMAYGYPGVQHFFFGDLQKLSGQAMLDTLGLGPGDVDLVVGGPPCQGFSTVGKRQVMDPRNSLVFDWARLVVEIQPKAMCMENVPGMVSMVTQAGAPVIDELCAILERGDYCDFDAAQQMLAEDPSRRRVKRRRPRKPETSEPTPQQALFPETS